MSQPYWVEVKVEVDIEAEVEMRSSRSLVEIELSMGWDKLTLNKGRHWGFIEVELCYKLCFSCTNAAEQHMFSMSPPNLAFNFI